MSAKTEAVPLLSNHKLRCLRRISEGKSVPDFGAVCWLDKHGFLRMTGSGDDIWITVTAQGHAALVVLAPGLIK